MKWGQLLFLFCVLFLTVGRAVAADPVYVGYYRGSTNVMPVGLYSFTNLTDAAGSATRIGTAGFANLNWQKMAYDGSRYYTFVRNPVVVAKATGLYECDGANSYILISTNSETGLTYTFSDWHGIAYCDLSFYGLYDGANMTGPGLYRFIDPTDPEGTAERLFPSQTFPADIWSDVAFDGTRWLFVRTASSGTAGIYQYDPQTDSFTLVSGGETYSVWNGLGAYTEPVPPAENVPLLHKKIYVVLFGGQSNARAWGYHQYLLDTGNPLAVPQEDVEMFVGAGLTSVMNTLTNLQSGSGMTSIKTNGTFQYPELTVPPINRFGPELSMARTVRDLIHIPGSKVVVIKYAASGTSLYEDWKPNGTADSATDGVQYRNFQTTVNSGLDAIRARHPDYEIEIIGMGWVQGESDALEGQAANYFMNLTNFVADVRATFGSNIVFALSKLSPNQGTTANWETVQAAQQAADDADPKVVATSTTGTNYPTADGFTEGKLHYLSSALLLIGQDLGNAIMNASGLDADDDGLPDEWENSFAPGAAGLGTTPGADYDNDGLTDLQEYQAGTDPTNPSDRLTLTDAQMHGRWAAKKDVRYQMLVSSNLNSWMEFGEPVLLRESNNTVEVDFTPYLTTNSSGFFKLHVL